MKLFGYKFSVTKTKVGTTLTERMVNAKASAKSARETAIEESRLKRAALYTKAAEVSAMAAAKFLIRATEIANDVKSDK